MSVGDEAECGFRNGTSFVFDKISSEEWREYRFPGDEIVRIDKPLLLHVSASGGHRIYDGYGISHYVPPGWLHLCWKTKEGCSHFVK